MEKSKILMVGCGGCGNKQLSIFLDFDARYSGIFMNSNLSEMENLKHFDRLRNCFYIPNADGTGKDRDLSEKYIKEEAPKFAEMIKKFINQDTVYFSGSLNGGTGSKAIILLSKLTKRFCPEKSLNILGTVPSINESDIDFNNTIDTWNEIIDLRKKGIIDTIQLIDNNKLDDEDEINRRAMAEFDSGFDVVGGKLDSSDSARVHHSKGYKVILKLDDKFKDTKEAINHSIMDSMFYSPDNLECDVMIGNINTNKLNLKTIKDEFEVYDFVKFNESESSNNTVVLGGCEMPKEAIELVKEALKEIKKKKKARIEEEDLTVRRHIAADEIQPKEVESNSKLSSKDINSIFANDNFWDN